MSEPDKKKDEEDLEEFSLDNLPKAKILEPKDLPELKSLKPEELPTVQTIGWRKRKRRET